MGLLILSMCLTRPAAGFVSEGLGKVHLPFDRQDYFMQMQQLTSAKIREDHE